MFRPLRDQILVKPIPWRQSRTIEVVSNERYSRAIVIAVGPGEPLKRNGKFTGRLRDMDVKPGDYITYGFDHIFPVYCEDGIEYRVLQDKDVTFISDPEFIDAHSSLTDAEIEAMIRAHNRPILTVDCIVKNMIAESDAALSRHRKIAAESFV